MSLTLALVRSLRRCQAPEPSLLSLGGTPSEPVDVDEDDVVVLVEELDHLLRLSGHVGADEPAEAAYAVVGVYHEVSRLELLELAEAHGELSAAGPFGAEVVAVEAVEDLVVREETGPGGVVHESGVQGGGHRCEVEGRRAAFRTPFREDGTQAFGLGGGVGEEVYSISLGGISREGPLYEVEILVVEGLGVGGEAYHVRAFRVGLGGEDHAPGDLEQGAEGVGAHHL